MDEEHVEFSFSHGIVQNRNVARVISQFDELVNYGSTSCSLMMWTRNRNQWHHFNVGWTAIRLACFEAGMYALGADGHLLRADAKGVNELEIAETLLFTV